MSKKLKPGQKWVPTKVGSMKRRGFLAGLSSFLAVPLVAPSIIRTPGLLMSIKPLRGNLYEELEAVTVRAFVPRVFVQIYRSDHPVLLTLWDNSEGFRQ